jgi:hypothetical protein
MEGRRWRACKFACVLLLNCFLLAAPRASPAGRTSPQLACPASHRCPAHSRAAARDGLATTRTGLHANPWSPTDPPARLRGSPNLSCSPDLLGSAPHTLVVSHFGPVARPRSGSPCLMRQHRRTAAGPWDGSPCLIPQRRRTAARHA